VSIFRTGMPTLTLPLVMGANDRGDRNGVLGAIVAGPVNTPLNACDPMGPYFVTSITP